MSVFAQQVKANAALPYGVYAADPQGTVAIPQRKPIKIKTAFICSVTLTGLNSVIQQPTWSSRCLCYSVHMQCTVRMSFWTLLIPCLTN